MASRKTLPALTRGSMVRLVGLPQSVIGFVRNTPQPVVANAQPVVVLHNLSAKAQTFTLPLRAVLGDQSTLAPPTSLYDWVSEQSLPLNDKGNITLQPYQSVWLTQP